MATAKKKSPTKRAKATRKKAAAKRKTSVKKVARKAPAKRKAAKKKVVRKVKAARKTVAKKAASAEIASPAVAKANDAVAKLTKSIESDKKALAAARKKVERARKAAAIIAVNAGAAIYVAEHAEDHKRGAATGWIQSSAAFGLIAALLVIYFTRTTVGWTRWRQELTRAYDRGSAAAQKLPACCIPYEELLPRPIAEVREFLGVPPLPEDVVLGDDLGKCLRFLQLDPIHVRNTDVAGRMVHENANWTYRRAQRIPQPCLTVFTILSGRGAILERIQEKKGAMISIPLPLNEAVFVGHQVRQCHLHRVATVVVPDH